MLHQGPVLLHSVDLLPRNHLPTSDPIVAVNKILKLLGGKKEEQVKGEVPNPHMKDFSPNGCFKANHQFGDFKGEFKGVGIDGVILEGLDRFKVEVTRVPFHPIEDTLRGVVFG